MIRLLLFSALCLSVLFSFQVAYAEDNLPLPEGKNIREWESISAALISEKRFDEAILYLDKILEQDPNNLKALSNKAGLLIQLERFSESLIISNRVLEVDPDRISTLTNKAIALKMLKEYEKSFLVFSKIISLEPENEAAQKSRAKLLSSTPTVSTSDSEYFVHALLVFRDVDGNLIGTVESSNARYLPSSFTDRWWESLDKKGVIVKIEKKEMFTKTNLLIPQDNYVGMITLEKDMSGYNVNIFELFIPMIQVEKTDVATVQWTIIKG